MGIAMVILMRIWPSIRSTQIRDISLLLCARTYWYALSRHLPSRFHRHAHRLFCEKSEQSVAKIRYYTRTSWVISRRWIRSAATPRWGFYRRTTSWRMTSCWITWRGVLYVNNRKLVASWWWAAQTRIRARVRTRESERTALGHR